jgi:predicted Fe-Mo cluster-binding NifX family protein
MKSLIKPQWITAKNFVPNPGHRSGFLSIFLGDMGVGVVIAGGMGESAVGTLKERGIEVLTGFGSRGQEKVELYLAGK